MPDTPADRLALPAGVVAASTLERLQSLLSAPLRTSLVILESEYPEVGTVAGRALGASLLSSDHAVTTDLKVVSPDGDRWTIAELDEKVVSPSAYIPVERNVVVVGMAEAMDRSAAEHLLKTVEEPPSDTLFVFCVPSAALLLPTMQGRAGAVVQLEPAPRSDRVAALVSSGLPEAVAGEVVDLAGSSPSLSAAVAAADEPLREQLLVDLRRLGPSPLGSPSPSTLAHELAGTLERLAVLAASPEGSKPKVSRSKAKPSLSPQARAQVRMLLRDRIGAWRRQTSAALREASSAPELARVTTRLEALDRAELEISSFAPAANVLAALLARTTS